MSRSAPNNDEKFDAKLHLGLLKGDIIEGWTGPRLLTSKSLFA